MTPTTRGWRRVLPRWLRDPAADVDEELRFHFDARVEDLVARGATPDAARAQALAEFGDVDAVRTTLSEIDARLAKQHRRADRWEAIAQDVGYVMRGLRRSPGFAAAVMVTLALGIGTNAAIFSVLERMFLRAPAGVADVNRVGRIYYHRVNATRGPSTQSVYAYPEVRALAAGMPHGVLVAGYHVNELKVGPPGHTVDAIGTVVVGPYFDALGVRPATGRFFSQEEARIETPAPVMVIGFGMWMDRFGGSTSALGQQLDVGNARYTIIGVAPRNFRGVDLEPSDFWIPMSMMAWGGTNPTWYESRGTGFIQTITRAGPDVSATAIEGTATAALRRVALRPDSTGTAELAPVRDAAGPMRASKDTVPVRLAGVAVVILLIACATVANLLLARGMRRRREIAVRLALGVSRARLVGQLVTESVVLASLAAVPAVLVAVWGASTLRGMLLPNVKWTDLPLDGRLVAFTLVVTLVAGVGAGLVPSLQSSRLDLNSALKGSVHEGAFHRSRLRAAVLVLQTALSVVLLVVSGLFVRSLRDVQAVDIGYDSERLIFASASFERGHAPPDAELSARIADIAKRLARVPGVERLALAADRPMNGFSWLDLRVPGLDSVPQIGTLPPIVSYVAPGYFGAAGMRVLHGRDFTADDRTGTPLITIVNATMANALWPGREAVGQCMMFEPGQACRRVVGVVSNAHVTGIIETPTMRYYAPVAQAPAGWSASTIAIRVAPGQGVPVIDQARRELMAAFTSGQPRVVRMTDILAPQLKPWRDRAALFSVAGLLALLVAAVGVYSMVSYIFSQRAHEMGIRIALGARMAGIVRLVVGEGLRVVLAGLLTGTAIALALGKLVAAQLYGVSPRDPAVLVTVSIVLIAVAVVACLVPAWRATRVDPVEALRAE